jgi:hypothetical protein
VEYTFCASWMQKCFLKIGVIMEADCKNHCDLILGHCHEVYWSLAQVSQVWQPEKAFN